MQSVKDKQADSIRSDFLAKRPLIIAANRGPVTFESTETGEVRFERGTGGLVTAVSSLAQFGDTRWIACARTEADAAWHEGRIPLSEDQSELWLEFLLPEPHAYDGYYNTIANPLLWFLQHSMWDISRTPIINRTTWEAWGNGYVEVNRLFAEAITRQVKTLQGHPIVMLQDYHLYLVPRMLRQLLRPRERPAILHFTHIPWPGPEYWRILPPAMRQSILAGLAGADILGFQTRGDGLNFLRTCQTHLPGAHVKYDLGRLWYHNHATYIRDYPISIDIHALQETTELTEVTNERARFQKFIGDDSQLILRIDRIEPSKNILRGFQAFGEMLELYPEHQGNVKFLALLVPSRLDVEEYQNYLDELMAAAGRINVNFGTSEWEPVRVMVGESYPRAIAALQLYDVLLVNSIADGMNLVAKEGPMVNQRSGVLILSEGTGAYEQLGEEALVISPCDVYATAQALHQALTMPFEERHNHAMQLRTVIEQDDILAWLDKQLLAIAELKL